jgi:hypothetical protein
MKNNIYRITGVLVIVVTFLFSAIIFSTGDKSYPISRYFPLNTNDKYIYDHYEGDERDIVSITVKNVKKAGREKSFQFFWQGRYNDRIQSLKLSPQGITFYSNRHLVGQPPLKVIRKLSPPLLMIPARLSRLMTTSAVQSIQGLNGKLIGKENIRANISFIGYEDIKVKAGNFRCIHFSVTHTYKDSSKNSIQMHTYNFWIAPGVGIVKFIHAFIPFIYVKYIPPGEKNIMNRYSGPFEAIFDLREALIKGKTIANDY